MSSQSMRYVKVKMDIDTTNDREDMRTFLGLANQSVKGAQQGTELSRGV